jgi:hypothetical protein
MFGRFSKKVWPLSPRKGENFTEKTPGNYKKVWPSFEGAKMLVIAKELGGRPAARESENVLMPVSRHTMLPRRAY